MSKTLLLFKVAEFFYPANSWKGGLPMAKIVNVTAGEDHILVIELDSLIKSATI